MQSKTSFFNKTIFVKNLTRFWPLWLAYLVLWLIVGPISFMTTAGHRNWLRSDLGAGLEIISTGEAIGIFMAVAFGVLAAMAVYSYLYTGKSAGMMASLPITRTEMFLTNYFSGLICLVGVNIITAMGFALVEIFYGCLGVQYLLQWLAIVTMQIVFFYSLASLCAVFTGHVLVLPVLYGIINFAAVAVESFIEEILRYIVYGYCASGSMAAAPLSPPVQMAEYSAYIVDKMTGAHIDSMNYTADSMSYVGAPASQIIDQANYTITYTGWTGMLVYTLVAAVFVAAALLIFRRRHMESASDVVAVKVLKPIFKYFMTFGSALILGTGLYMIVFAADKTAGGIVPIILCMLIGGFVGYFASEMMMQKSFKVFKKWKGFIVSACVIIALLASCEMGAFGYEKRVPELDEVESIEVSASGEYLLLEGEEDIEKMLALHESIIANKAWNESDSAEYGETVHFDYLLNDGTALKRRYTIKYDIPVDESSDVYILNAIYNTDEAIQSRKKMEIPVTVRNIEYASIDYYNKATGMHESFELAPEQAAELYENCILPEIESGALGRVWLYQDGGYEGSYYDTVYEGQINIEVAMRNSSGELERDYFYTVPTVDSVKTNEYLEKLGIKMYLEREILDYTKY